MKQSPASAIWPVHPIYLLIQLRETTRLREALLLTAYPWGPSS